MSHLIGRVVVGVHGTPGSLQALRFAVGHARALGVTLMPVIAWEPPGGDSAGRRYPPFLMDAWADAAEKRLLTAFDEALGGPPQDLPTLPMVVRGRPGEVLAAMADRDSDLLVVGRARRGRLHRAYYGSPPQYCLAHAGCAVIVVPPSRLTRELDDARSVWRWRHRSAGRAAQLDDLPEPGGAWAPWSARPPPPAP
ncbi:MAG TPA: universal stress protein [Actinocrinis sp.]|uniref:universal stress protein n=1 Tax=Actinocrinis sp. TaxID=1920516 RepID=UPI002D382A8F|nr:universal stress protein [Actinocrinis sp.]HZU56786.1 universal stress protein [Actinocrinis sp.]